MTAAVYSGSGADVSIIVKTVSDAVTVPTAAVTTFAAFHSVTVLSGGKAVRRIVVLVPPTRL